MLKVKVEPVEPGLYGKVPLPRNPLTIAGYQVYCSEEQDSELQPPEETDEEAQRILSHDDGNPLESNPLVVMNGADEGEPQEEYPMEAPLSSVAVSIGDLENSTVDTEVVEEQVVDDSMVLVNSADCDSADLIQLPYLQTTPAEVLVIEEGAHMMVADGSVEGGELLLTENGEYMIAPNRTLLVQGEGSEVVSIMTADQNGVTLEDSDMDQGHMPDHVVVERIDYEMPVIQHEEDTEFFVQEETIGEQQPEDVEQIVQCVEELQSTPSGKLYYFVDQGSPESASTVESQSTHQKKSSKKTPKKKKPVKRKSVSDMASTQTDHSEAISTPKSRKRKKSESSSNKKKKEGGSPCQEQMLELSMTEPKAVSPIQAKHPTISLLLNSNSLPMSPSLPTLGTSLNSPASPSSANLKPLASPTIVKPVANMKTIASPEKAGIQPSASPGIAGKEVDSPVKSVTSPKAMVTSLDSPTSKTKSSQPNPKPLKSRKIPAESILKSLSVSPEPTIMPACETIPNPLGVTCTTVANPESVLVPLPVAIASPAQNLTQSSPAGTCEDTSEVDERLPSEAPIPQDFSGTEVTVAGKNVTEILQVPPVKKAPTPVLSKSLHCKSPKNQRPVLVPILPPERTEEKQSSFPTANKIPGKAQIKSNVSVSTHANVQAVLSGGQPVLIEQIKKSKKSIRVEKTPIALSVPLTTLAGSVTSGPVAESRNASEVSAVIAVPTEGMNQIQVPEDLSTSQTVKTSVLYPVQSISSRAAGIQVLSPQSLTQSVQTAVPILSSMPVVSLAAASSPAVEPPGLTAASSSIQRQHQLVTSTLQSRLAVSPASPGETRETLADRYMKEWKPTGRFQCKLCFYSCVTHNFLFRHWVLNHCTLRPYMCGHCGFQSATRDGVTRHQTAKHRGNPRQVFIDTEQQELLWNKFDEMFQGSGFVSPNISVDTDAPTDLSVPQDPTVVDERDHVRDRNVLVEKPGATILNVPVRQKNSKKGKKSLRVLSATIVTRELQYMEDVSESGTKQASPAGFNSKDFDVGSMPSLQVGDLQETNAAIQAALQTPPNRRHTGVCEGSTDGLPQAGSGEGSCCSDEKDPTAICSCVPHGAHSDHCPTLALQLSSSTNTESGVQQQQQKQKQQQTNSLLQVHLTPQPSITASQQPSASTPLTHPTQQNNEASDIQIVENDLSNQDLILTQSLQGEDEEDTPAIVQQEPLPESPEKLSKGNPESMFSLLQRTIEESFSRNKNSLLTTNKTAAPDLGSHQVTPNVTTPFDTEYPAGVLVTEARLSVTPTDNTS